MYIINMHFNYGDQGANEALIDVEVSA